MALTYLADACALIAYEGEGGVTMTDAGRSVMRSAPVFVSSVTIWEITRKVSLGKLARPVPKGFAGSFADFVRSRRYGVLPLDWDEAEHANALPPHHNDPMDRMLIATALRRNLTIITSDRLFSPYGVNTIW